MLEFERLVAQLNAGSYLPPQEKSVMAKQVKLGKGKEFTFTKASAQSKYPWDQWLNGDLLLLERSDVTEGTNELAPGGEKRDFEVDADAMIAKLKTAAKRRYKVVQVSKKDAEGAKLVGAVIIKARPMDDSERQAEDVRRAELKAAGQAEQEAGDEAAA